MTDPTLIFLLEFLQLLFMTYGLTRLSTTYLGERYTEGKIGYLLGCYQCSGFYLALLSLLIQALSPALSHAVFTFALAIITWDSYLERKPQ